MGIIDCRGELDAAERRGAPPVGFTKHAGERVMDPMKKDRETRLHKTERDRVDKDRNPDPITGTSGAHPIGTAGGAAGAGAAGAAIGATGGPVGAMVGGAIGAIAGGLVGKGV